MNLFNRKFEKTSLDMENINTATKIQLGTSDLDVWKPDGDFFKAFDEIHNEIGLASAMLLYNTAQIAILLEHLLERLERRIV